MLPFSTSSAFETFPKHLFITGTDTDVGKTFVTAWIAGVWLALGKTVAVYKPVQTGVTCVEAGDAYWVGQFWNFPQQLTLKTSYLFPEPAAPSVADGNDQISFHQLVEDFQALQATHDVVLVEGAGGVLCPIRKYLFMADLIRHFNLPALVVTRPNLGTINHTLMSIEVLRGRGVTPCGILINEGANPLASDEKQSLAVRTVASELAKYSGTPLWPSLPSIQDLRSISLEDTSDWFGEFLAQQNKTLKKASALEGASPAVVSPSSSSLLTPSLDTHLHHTHCGCGHTS
jgi:dethiobiotin synthetase